MQSSNNTSGRIVTIKRTIGTNSCLWRSSVITTLAQEPPRLHENLRAEVHYAQTAHAEQANQHRHPDPVLRAGDQVWLKRKNVKTTRPSNKLDYKLLGPYTILARVGSRTYKLDLPLNVKIHPVFHISLLEPSQPTSTTIPGHIQPPPLPIILDDEEEWEVEEIVDS
jgi:hypothetical protein